MYDPENLLPKEEKKNLHCFYDRCESVISYQISM